MESELAEALEPLIAEIEVKRPDLFQVHVSMPVHLSFTVGELRAMIRALNGAFKTKSMLRRHGFDTMKLERKS